MTKYSSSTVCKGLRCQPIQSYHDVFPHATPVGCWIHCLFGEPILSTNSPALSIDSWPTLWAGPEFKACSTPRNTESWVWVRSVLRAITIRVQISVEPDLRPVPGKRVNRGSKVLCCWGWRRWKFFQGCSNQMSRKKGSYDKIQYQLFLWGSTLSTYPRLPWCVSTYYPYLLLE